MLTDKDLWPSQWASQARLSIVRGPKFSERVDLDGSMSDVQSYEIQFAVRAHREQATPRTPAENEDAKAQTQRGRQPNFPLVVDFRADDRSGQENRERNYFVIQRQPPFWCCTPLKDHVAGVPAVPWLVAVEDVDARLVADIWNTVADRYLEAVREIRNDRKLSLFPRLAVNHGGKGPNGDPIKEAGDARVFTLIFRLLDAPDPKQLDKGSVLQPTLWRLEPGRLQALSGGAETAPDQSEKPLFRGHAELPLFKSVDSGPFTFPFQLRARPKEAFDAATAVDNWRIDVLRQIAGLDPYRKAVKPEPAKLVEFLDVELHQVQDDQGADNSSPKFDLGAYALALNPAPDPALGSRDTRPIFQVWFDTDWKASKASQLDGDTSDFALRHATYVNIRYGLSLADFYPSGQDKLPDEPDNAVRPVMVKLPSHVAPDQVSGQAAPGSPGLSLTIAESSAKDSRFGGVDQRQKVLLTVSAPARSIPPTDVLVIDTEPFFIAKVEVPSPQPSDENTAIAVWDSDGPEGPYWRVAADASGYSLFLPPQAIGETAIKTDRYALPDQIDRPDPQRNDPAKDDPNLALADFRFSPNARLKVYTSWREANSGFVEPPFNTRRIFGFASQRAPGAPLVNSAFELLYGLSATMSGAAVEGQSTRLVTELAAQEGFPPRPVDNNPPDWGVDFHYDARDPQDWPSATKGYLKSVKALYDDQLGDDHYKRFVRDWDAARTAFQRRLAVLMVQDKARGNVDAFTDGVGFQLREQAQIRRPVLPIAPNSKSPYRPGGARDPAKRPPETMLDGGADWGFESSNVYEEIWRTPSDGGELAQVYFSALGAWGRQKARFANRKSAIISQAGQGRTHFYSLERIGRIGVFWNRAKHVIVYRRSVLPSSQFKKKQARFEGRPFLRKVLEYVELLQPERKFPEDGFAPVRRGFAESIVFRSKIILVDSDWGQDIFDGWKIPLWNPLADPKIYPKPQVELKFAQDAKLEAEAGPAFIAIAEPQNLVFFTSTHPKATDDTDAWPPVHAIDFVNLPAPTKVDLQTHVPRAADVVLSPDRPVPAGFEPVTFVLDRTARRAANLVAERGGTPGAATPPATASTSMGTSLAGGAQPTGATPTAGATSSANAISAVVGTITLARPAPNAVPAADDGVTGTRSFVANLREDIYSLQKDIADSKIDLNSLRDRIANLKPLESSGQKAIDSLYSTSNVSNICKKVDTSVKTQISKAVTRIHNEINGPDGVLTPFITDAGNIIVDLEAKLSAATNLSELKGIINAGYARIEAAFDSLDAQKKVILRTFTTPLDQIRNALPKTNDLKTAKDFLIQRLTAEVGLCQSAIGDLKKDAADLRRISGSLRGLADQVLADYDAGLNSLFDLTRKTLPKVAYEVEVSVRQAPDRSARRHSATALGGEHNRRGRRSDARPGARPLHRRVAGNDRRDRRCRDRVGRCFSAAERSIYDVLRQYYRRRSEPAEETGGKPMGGL